MTALESDLEVLERAMRMFFQTMKRPQHWATVSARSGLTIDRPSSGILHILMHSKGHACRVQDVAHLLGVEAPSVTRKTQELELSGLIRRVPDPRDKRAVDLRITPRGRMIAKRLWQAQREVMYQTLSNWDESERRTFVKLFERFSQDYVNSVEAEHQNKRKD